MAVLNRDDFRQLAEYQSTASCAVTLYISAENAGKLAFEEVHQKALKSRLNDIRRQLKDRGWGEHAIDPWMRPAYDLISDRDFWHQPAYGVALYLSPEGMQSFHLTYPLPDQSYLGPRFWLRPVLPELSRQTEAFVLSLSKHRIRLLKANHFGAREYDLPQEAPRKLQDLLQYYDFERELRKNEAGVPMDQAANTHGADPDQDDEYKYLQDYFLRLQEALHDYLQDEQTPVVLAGTEEDVHRFRQVNHHFNLYSEALFGNHDKYTKEAIHRELYPVLEQMDRGREQYYRRRYQERSGTGLTTYQAEEIVLGALDGRNEALFVPYNLHWPGTVDHQQRQVRFSQDLHTHEDLLDQAAVHSFLQGGEVFLVQEAGEIPEPDDPAQACALLRW
jgi:hypothetical protein